MTRTVDVTVTYLAMTSPAQLRPAATVPPGIALVHIDATGEGAPKVVAQLYEDVGARWHWHDRRDWSEQAWADAIRREGVEVWVAVQVSDGTTVGYFELERRGPDVDIRYFGLLGPFIGRGIGGWLLTQAVERAWSLEPARVTLNTCSLDGEAALPNYRARGFEIVRIAQQRREVSDEPR